MKAIGFGRKIFLAGLLATALSSLAGCYAYVDDDHHHHYRGNYYSRDYPYRYRYSYHDRDRW